MRARKEVFQPVSASFEIDHIYPGDVVERHGRAGICQGGRVDRLPRGLRCIVAYYHVAAFIIAIVAQR